ncbi:HNH endonuclease [Isoptericola sp. S6320L]|uniref:HNH endonuclease signature motif containing protein n=1 Tax=Isoptericola sp. S6320L TaxID=2926411 RepID=UPI001FF5DF97|nr:HNH endonuclease signature motif containing protein [Isoptericola sp. S6320L]MCK0117268.1 HNH endonuclease [Isoptericola sp. S6320L]
MTTRSADTRTRADSGARRRPAGRDVTLARLDELLADLSAAQAEINALEGRRAALLADIADLAEDAESAVLDTDDPSLRRTSSSRRRELVRRAVVAEVGTTLRLGEHAAGSLCEQAQTLRRKAPRSFAALAAGRCSWAHAARLARHLADLDPADARRVESSVAPALATSTPAQVDARTRRARDNVHPEPVEVRSAKASEHRAVYLDDARDGMAWLTAHLPVTLAHAAYDRLTRTATALHAETDSLTVSQGRADVLAALLLDDGTLDRDAVPATAPGRDSGTAPGTARTRPVLGIATIARSIRPQVTVTVPVLTLLGVADIPADLDGHVPVAPDTARELAALAPSLRRVLTHPESGVPLSVGRESYTAPSALKATLRHRDATCRFPGCTVPAVRADLDHTTAWADGGTTGADNLAHLCRHHHVLKHQTGWTARQGPAPGGNLEWTSPTGRRHTTRPDGGVVASRHGSAPRDSAPRDLSSVGSGDPPF